MRQSNEYLARAVEAERKASVAKQASAKADFLSVAACWRDLARQADDLDWTAESAKPQRPAD